MNHRFITWTQTIVTIWRISVLFFWPLRENNNGMWKWFLLKWSCRREKNRDLVKTVIVYVKDEKENLRRNISMEYYLKHNAKALCVFEKLSGYLSKERMVKNPYHFLKGWEKRPQTVDLPISNKIWN